MLLFHQGKDFLKFFLRVNLAIMLLQIFQYVLLVTLVKGCWTLISTLHQMQIIYIFCQVCVWAALLTFTNKYRYVKIKPGTLAAGAVRNNFKEKIERFVASECIFIYEINRRNTSILEMTFIWCNSCG